MSLQIYKEVIESLSEDCGDLDVLLYLHKNLNPELRFSSTNLSQEAAAILFSLTRSLGKVSGKIAAINKSLEKQAVKGDDSDETITFEQEMIKIEQRYKGIVKQAFEIYTILESSAVNKDLLPS